MKPYDPELPPGYAEAYNAYHDCESVENIWVYLNCWRNYEKGFVGVGLFDEEKIGFVGTVNLFESELKHRKPVAYQLILERTQKRNTEFQARILKAVLEGDKPFLAKLSKAINAANYPKPEIHGAYAAIRAFYQLFIGEGYVSRDDWPTKQEVRRRAEDILTKEGLALPSDRHWPRIFKQAGLSDLNSVTYGKARKNKASRTKLTQT